MCHIQGAWYTSKDSSTHGYHDMSHAGIASYTASWIAPKSDVHSQQRFFCMCHGGEVAVDQAHRGYTVSSDGQFFLHT
jgi:hypothetical protein